MKARLAILVAMCVAATLTACGDPTSLQATNLTTTDTLSVFALSGTPPSYPSGISILAGQAIPVDGSALFDVAFDLDPSGNAVVYPPKLVVNSLGGSRLVGLLKTTGSFESVLEAPKTGYATDASVTLVPGETVVMQSPHNFGSDICQFALTPYLYAKVTFDSVNVANRILYLRMGVDPNCGFRSFASGVPTS